MECSEQALAKTHRALPLLALRDITLFPHTLVPFHVSSAEHAQIVDSALAGRRLIVVAGLKPQGLPTDIAGEVEAYGVGGLGRVVSDKRYRNGSTTVFVHCIQRVEIVRYVQSEPTKLVDVVHLPDRNRLSEKDALVSHLRLVSLASSLARELKAHGGLLSKVVSSTADCSVLSHRLAAILVDEPRLRQQLLEMPSSSERCRHLEPYFADALLESFKADGIPQKRMN